MNSELRGKIAGIIIAVLIAVIKDIAERKFRMPPESHLKESIVSFISPIYILLLVYIMNGAESYKEIYRFKPIFTAVPGIFIWFWIKSCSNYKAWKASK